MTNDAMRWLTDATAQDDRAYSVSMLTMAMFGVIAMLITRRIKAEAMALNLSVRPATEQPTIPPPTMTTRA